LENPERAASKGVERQARSAIGGKEYHGR